MIGKKLKSIRNKRGYTLRQLEKLSGVSHGFLCDIEHDRSDPSLETLHKIANALEIEPAYFLNNANTDEQTNKTA
ncbi:helix-turn-helix domain-containing protein [Mahella australiensis]|uniref:Helix-turn-helix domain protein n=1 Tax=Mahella australiensis (strain DSM 15567 / CIP 107919 / 50-1 BON) TaxID=697281 RepID=F3ZZD6_MAHA5|nr:helix-turn-helix transcriptional regulator [Mahella australiensis]AEE95746.1 helix-turn-helix domain protein [Mahella australiensis 50-1 BON]